jgi:hypothetical protein
MCMPGGAQECVRETRAIRNFDSARDHSKLLPFGQFIARADGPGTGYDTMLLT